MSFFQDFPLITYLYNINGKNELRVVNDITMNIRIKKQVLSNITLYEDYDIIDGDTPERIADKIYGDPNLNWVIMLTNDKFSNINDFPMSNTVLEKYIEKKYASIPAIVGIDETAKVLLHGFSFANPGTVSIAGLTVTSDGSAIFTGAQSASVFLGSIVAGLSLSGTLVDYTLLNDTPDEPATIVFVSTSPSVPVLDLVAYTTGTGLVPTITITQGVTPISKRNTQHLIWGNLHFEDGSGNIVPGVLEVSNTIFGNPTIDTPWVDISYQVNPLAIAISNYDHEFKINESKRRIRLIHPKLIPRILSDLKAAITSESF